MCIPTPFFPLNSSGIKESRKGNTPCQIHTVTKNETVTAYCILYMQYIHTCLYMFQESRTISSVHSVHGSSFLIFVSFEICNSDKYLHICIIKKVNEHSKVVVAGNHMVKRCCTLAYQFNNKLYTTESLYYIIIIIVWHRGKFLCNSTRCGRKNHNKIRSHQIFFCCFLFVSCCLSALCCAMLKKGCENGMR